MALPVQLGFDYSALSPNVREAVESARDDIKRREKRAAEDIIEIGKRLLDVKAALPHGRFGSWLGAEFGWSADTASNFMKVARTFANIPKISEFALSALYALASGDVPEMVREHFVEKAASGQPVRYSEVREVVQAVKDAERVAENAPMDTPLLSIVDLNTGEVIDPYPPASRREASLPTLREPTPEERAFDRLVGVSSVTQMNADAVAEAATIYRGEVARMYLRRAEEILAWHARLVDGLRARLDAPLRAVK